MINIDKKLEFVIPGHMKFHLILIFCHPNTINLFHNWIKCEFTDEVYKILDLFQI